MEFCINIKPILHDDKFNELGDNSDQMSMIFRALLKMLTGDSELWHQDLSLYWEVCQIKGHPADKVYLQLCQALGVLDVHNLQVCEGHG